MIPAYFLDSVSRLLWGHGESKQSLKELLSGVDRDLISGKPKKLEFMESATGKEVNALIQHSVVRIL